MKKHTYGGLFKSVRLAFGYTLEQMAEKLGLHISAISLYENGYRMPRVTTLLWYLEQAGTTSYTEKECPYCNGTGKIRVPKERQGDISSSGSK